jgi:hypothetical protein
VSPLSSLRLLCSVAVLALLGCSREVIPNTGVEDSEFNRHVIAFCEDYRHAVERRNTPLLVKLADAKYYEDGGTVDTSDDLDFEGLEVYLKQEFAKTKAIRYEIFYRDVTTGRSDQIFVDYTYSASYQVPTTKRNADGKDELTYIWRRSVADNRLELIRDGEKFRILSGM